uniref:SFRICE_001305 n=1 Tax=Spodoptera frugiperda TaxID=7108 RepID=A0A2H1VRZ3_SPOFR
MKVTSIEINLNLLLNISLGAGAVSVVGMRARCIVDKIYQGTCVRLFKCGSAVLTYLYRNAGFENDTSLPPLPELCSHRSEEPVVCCTDCVLSTNDEFEGRIGSGIPPTTAAAYIQGVGRCTFWDPSQQDGFKSLENVIRPNHAYSLLYATNYALRPTRYKLRATTYALQTTRYNPRATNYALEPTRYKLRATTHALQTTRYDPRATNYALQPTRYNLHATTHALQATRYKLRASNYMLQPTRYKLRATNYALQTTCYDLCATNCALQTMRYDLQCLDYFHKLPYPCRGKGLVSIEKQWVEATRCHDSVLRVNVSATEPKPLQWNFPHQARLGYGDDLSSVQWLCEGTVISERFILTSAHCTNAGVFGTIAFASLGLQNNKEPPEYWNTHKIKKVIIHPSYNEPSWYHDIALLETETEIMFDSQILPACLDVDVHDKSVAETAGKRTQAIDNNISETSDMQPILFNELDTIDCILAYKRANNLMHGFDSKLQMCYGRQNVSEETCKRFSGSPLQIDQSRCQYTVVGVTAHTGTCGRPDVPEIFTNVRHYLPWIESIVWPGED